MDELQRAYLRSGGYEKKKIVAVEADGFENEIGNVIDKGERVLKEILGIKHMVTSSHAPSQAFAELSV